MNLLEQQFQTWLERPTRRQRFFRQVIADGQRVLDVGCGVGFNAEAVQRVHSNVTIDGVDVLDPKDVRPAVRYQQLDITTERLPFNDNTFDRILFTHVIEHIQDGHMVMREMLRVLKPGGWLYLETPSPISSRLPSWPWRMSQGGPMNFFDDPTHIRVVPPSELMQLMESTGWTKARVGTLRNIPKLILDPFMILGGLLLQRRPIVINAVWNLTGWVTWGEAQKPA